MSNFETTNERSPMSAPQAPEKAGKSGWLRRFLPLFAIAGGLGLFFLLGFDRYLSFDALSENREWLVAQVEESPVTVALAFVLVYAVIVGLSIPGGALMTVTSGFLFGPFLGTAYAVVGATVGATAVFLAARTSLGEVMRAKAGPSVQRMREGFQANALSYLLFLRQIPVFPFWLVNLVPALIGVPLRTFVIGTGLGIIPGTLVYASLGNGLGTMMAAGERPDLGIIFQPAILLPILGLAVLALIPVIYKKVRARRAAQG